MSSEINKTAIFSSVACIQSYFQSNSINITHLTDLQPIPITRKKTTSSWMNSHTTYGLLDIVRQKIPKLINLTDFDDGLAPDINGFFVEQEKTVNIYVNKTLNFCQRRFIIAKELSHLLMNDVDKNLRIIPNTKGFLDLISTLTNHSKTATTPAELSEASAYLGAMELLIPRVYFESNWFQAQTNNYIIAQQIKCPTQIIEIRKRSDIIEIFNKVYEDPMYESTNMIDIVHRAKNKQE